jgi:O-antigen/teichoic acid export membrane protein
MMYKSNKKFFFYSFLSSLPGFISILLSLLSIPIYLKYGGAEEYGNYIFLHFISFVASIFNFGLGKISAITVAQNKDKDSRSLILLIKTLKNSSIIFLVLILVLLSNEFFLLGSRNILFLAIFSIILTIIFVTIEGIFQGKKLFLGLMLSNLFFFGISLSLPPVLLIVHFISYKTLFCISLVIKACVVIISAVYLFKGKPLKFFLKKRSSFNYNHTQKWFSISNILNILYDFADKYLIKIYMGPSALALYSIPQQLTGKLSIVSKGIAAVLLPSIAYEKKNNLKTKDFIISLKIFLFIIPLLIFLLFNQFNIFFTFWLENNSSTEIINLTKIFAIITWVACLSHLIISYFEGSGAIKKNSIIELTFYPFFIFFLFMTVLSKNLFLVAFTILLKEVLLYIFRSINLLKKIYLIKYSYLIIAFACYYLFYSIDIDFVEFFKNE